MEDYNLRKTLKKQLYSAGVPKIEIERDASKVRIHIHCAKPGMVIGKGGSEIEKLRLQCEKMLNKPVVINIVEVRQPDLNAQLVAEKHRLSAGEKNFFPPRHEGLHRPQHEAGRQRVSKRRFPAVWAALKSPEASSTTTVPFRCRRFVRISTTVLPKRTPPTAELA